jgi:hypothetical protein
MPTTMPPRPLPPPIAGEHDAIVVVPELAALWLPPTPEERERRAWALANRTQLLEPLAVWRNGPKQILLTDFDIFPQVRERRIPFRVQERHLDGWEQARLFVISEQLNRQHLSERGISYLRGVRCSEVPRRRHGGDRKGAASHAERAEQARQAACGNRPSVAALAEMFRVSERTIYHDLELVAAVQSIVGHCGDWARDVLLGRGYHLGRDAILDLADLEPPRQQELLGVLQAKKHLPRCWRNQGQPRTISVPRDLRERAQRMVKSEGPDAALELARLLTAAAEVQGKAVPPPSTGIDAETNGGLENPKPDSE